MKIVLKTFIALISLLTLLGIIMVFSASGYSSLKIDDAGKQAANGGRAGGTDETAAGEVGLEIRSHWRKGICFDDSDQY